MAINADKTHLWQEDIDSSVDYYNDWFIGFAPDTYRDQRAKQAELVEHAMAKTNNFRCITPETLVDDPLVLQVLRMSTAPPLARDRLIGLAYVSKNLVYSMEETEKHEPRLPPRMHKDRLAEELERICEVIQRMIDRDVCPWLDQEHHPGPTEIRRAASVFADRLCGTAADPIIRNAQEREQKQMLREWLIAREYQELDSASVRDVFLMSAGTFTFGCNVQVKVGDSVHRMPIDCLIKPHRSVSGEIPVFVEMKSAGDFTNPNKRQKEEAQKATQLRDTYGRELEFILFLRGYFGLTYLGYEAGHHLDWVWEHRIEDFSKLGLDKGPLLGDQIADGGEPYLDGGGSKSELGQRETQRLAAQKKLDRERPREERNRLGQFSTPPELAHEIVRTAQAFLNPNDSVDFLEPAFGTGAFLSAVLCNIGLERVGRCQGYEIDLHYAELAKEIWRDTPLQLQIADFTAVSPPDSESERFNLIATNPPYVRHHHIRADNKKRLGSVSASITGIQPSGLSGLYAYFVYIAHTWLREGGIGAWLIPSEFMYVNYGAQLRRYLLTKVTLLRLHRFDPQEIQFDDAIVSSTVVIFRKEKQSRSSHALFTYGGSLGQPKRERRIGIDELGLMSRWRNLFGKLPALQDAKAGIRLGDIFSIRRGIATGSNSFFIMTKEEAEDRGLPQRFLRYILPSPRHLKVDRIPSNDGRIPDITHKRLLLSCDLGEQEVSRQFPKLWSYLLTGKEQGVHERYLCSHRSPWYSQESREPAPILCSYMGRAVNGNKPFRFILNHSAAIAPNTYLNLYPKGKLKLLLEEQPHLVQLVFDALCRIPATDLVAGGRTYGGGLHKLEPKELENIRISIPDLDQLSRESPRQGVLFSM